MYFFETKLKEQRSIVLEILPFITHAYEKFIRISLKHSEDTPLQLEAKKAQKDARHALAESKSATLRAETAETEAVKPNATVGIKDTVEKARATAKLAREKLEKALETADIAVKAAEDEAAINSSAIFKDYINLLLENHYDEILKILALLNGTTAAALEEEKNLFDVGDMVLDVIRNERLGRFFPQLRQLAQKMQ